MRNRAVVRGVLTLFEAGTATGLSDGQLLEWYLRRGDDSAEAAFRALVDRHGPMVLRACRGVLHDFHAAEDAFQATFLILARKAGSIRRRDSIASWLFGVARRVAGRAAMQRQVRSAHERRAAELAEATAVAPPDRPAGPVAGVQEEVDRLPEHYRAPVVLCYLEGLTQEEAAIRLRLPPSTVRVRLMRARSRLRDRLTRRGLGPGALAGLAAGRAEAMVPAPLVEQTVQAATRFAVGRAAGASAPAAALAEGVIRAMSLARLKTAAALLAALTCASLGIIATLAGTAPPPRPDPPAGKVPQAVEKPKAQPQEHETEVTVAAVKRSRWERTTNQPGTVVAFDSADLHARIPGYLKTLRVDIGSRVKKGELLAEIHAPEVLAAVQRARAEILRVQRRVAKAQASLKVAQATLDIEHARVEAAQADVDASEATVQYRGRQLSRLKELVARGAVERRLEDEERDRLESARLGSKTIQIQLLVARAAEVEARAKLDAARADVEGAKTDVLVAEAGLSQEEALAGYTRIVSPYDGIVTRRNYHVGELVGSPNVGKFAPICSVVATDVMRVVVPVPDRDMLYVDVGDPATIWIDALGPGAPLKGRIARTAYEIDPNDRMLRVEIDLPNQDGRLRPGQFGRVEIELEARENVLTIPRSALAMRNNDGSAACYRVADGRAYRTRIKVGPDGSDRFEVLEGLKEGDVVIDRPHRLPDGQPVTIQREQDGEAGR